MIKPYPCEVNVGDHILTKNNGEYTVSAVDGKYIHTEDGNRFSFHHPDIVSVFIEDPTEEEILEEAIEEVRHEKIAEEEKKQSSSKKKSSKKKKEDAE